jgi:hypothetical protein
MSEFINAFINTKMSELTIGSLLTLFGLAILSAITMKFAIKFDLNNFLERRDQKLRSRIQQQCPHLSLKSEEKGIRFESFFYSPPGTIAWICKRCNFITYNISDEEIKNSAEYYIKNQKEYLSAHKKTDKLIKKLSN